MTSLPIRDERKSVTALFADVVGSTALTESIDPEDAREVIGGAVKHVIEGVEAFGGTIKDLAGDGVLALFGAPIAHEDDPERAIRAALRIVASIGSYADDVARRLRLPAFGIRIGIETGVAVLGSVGAGGRVEYGATGDAINTAARLEARAAPGTVLVGSSTQRLVARLFEWEVPVELMLSGKSEAVLAYRVIRPVTRPGGQRRSDAIQAPLLGREKELEVTHAQLDRLTRGTGGALFLIGEPGLGKSRLLEEMRRYGTGFEWLTGQCVSYGESLPYAPYREMLRGWAESEAPGHGGSEQAAFHAESVAAAALDNRLANLDGKVAQNLRRYLSPLLGGIPDDTDAATLDVLTPEALQYRTAEAMAEWLSLIARQRRVVAVLEDLHWSDNTSIQLTTRLLSTAARYPVLFVLTLRPERDHSAWRLRSFAADMLGGAVGEIVLESLPAGADETLLLALVGGNVLPTELRDNILSSAEGNPFFLEELVRSLVDSGALVPADGAVAGRWRFDHQVPVAVPSTIERVVQSRIDRLGPRARDALEAAAVLGRRFQGSALAAVARLNGSLDASLEELLALDLIRAEVGPANPEYRFKHALIQETAYNSLLKRRRRELHLLAAQSLETLNDAEIESMAAVIANHYQRAGDSPRAITFFEMAGDSAARVYAGDEALRAYGAAIEEAAGDDAARNIQARLALKRGIVRTQTGAAVEARSDFEIALSFAIETGDRTLEMRVQSELGFLLAGTADYRSALPRLDRSLELAQALGDANGQVAALARLALANVSQMLFATAVEQSERALEIARATGDEQIVATALDSLKQSALQLGDWATLERVASELEVTLRRQGNLWHLQFVLFEPAFAAAAEGRWEEAFGRVEAALAVNRRIGDRGNAALYPSTICRFGMWSGDYRRGLVGGREAVAAADAVGHAEWTAWSEIDLGSLLQEVGNFEEAAAHLARGAEVGAQASATFHAVRGAAHLANVQAVMGDLTAAERAADEVRSMLDQVELPRGKFWAMGADAYIHAAEVLLKCGRSAEARSMVEPLVAASGQRASAEAPTYGALVLGKCLLAQRAHGASLQQLHEAVAAAQRLRMPGAEWRLHAELAGLCELQAENHPGHDHAAEFSRLVTSLSAAIEDASMRQAFLAMAMSGGGSGP